MKKQLKSVDETVSKHLPTGDNHQNCCFVGAKISEKEFEHFTVYAKKSHRSRSGLIRYLIENADSILPEGDNHPISPSEIKLKADNGGGEAKDDESLNYQIIESQYAVVGLFGHNLIALRDPSKKIIAEMEGFATNNKGKVKAIGYFKSHHLKAHEFSKPYLYKKHQPQQIIYQGSETAVMARWAAAREGKEAINKLNLPYPRLGMGKNSNAVASTLIACMAIKESDICGARWAPSQGALLLSKSKIKAIQKRHDLQMDEREGECIES